MKINRFTIKLSFQNEISLLNEFVTFLADLCLPEVSTFLLEGAVGFLSINIDLEYQHFLLILCCINKLKKLTKGRSSVHFKFANVLDL